MKAALLVALTAGLVAAPAAAEPVMLISIDGLRPGDVIEAKQRGLNLPNLSRFVTEGAHASAVKGVLPTVTYPSHTTLLTGASPTRHGVVGNTTFDPRQINQGGWYWYAADIRVPTLWSAAAAAGIKVGNVHWPVSAGARDITWNLPQIWRTGHGDDAKLLSSLATPGLVAALEGATGEAYAAGIDESLAGDQNRGRFAAQLIRRHKPGFVTVYLTSLDHEQHAEGPDTAKPKAVLEAIDAIVGKLLAAQFAAHPDAVVAVVSDHGFVPIAHETNLFRAFADAGLIRFDAAGKVSGWDAMPWPSGGSAAVVLARPDDAALAARVAAVLDELKSDPANGIAMIADKAAIAALGANPQASFYVGFEPGWTAGAFAGAAGPLRGVPGSKGTHGYFPHYPAMRSSFMMLGRGVPRGHSFGEIDMRAIAPTLAKVLKVKLDGAEVPALSY